MVGVAKIAVEEANARATEDGAGVPEFIKAKGKAKERPPNGLKVPNPGWSLKMAARVLAITRMEQLELLSWLVKFFRCKVALQ